MKMNREEKTYRYNSDEATTQVSKVLFQSCPAYVVLGRMKTSYDGLTNAK